MSDLSDLTELQLRILQVLWDRGEAGVRDVMRGLPSDRERARSTIATLLSRLEDKGVVEHREVGRRYLYRATVGREEVRRRLLSDFADEVYQGNVPALVHHLMSLEDVDRADLERVRELIAEHTPPRAGTGEEDGGRTTGPDREGRGG